MSARQHKIWEIPEAVLRDVVARSTSFAEILRHFGITVEGKDYRALKQRVAMLEIDIAHIPRGSQCNKGKKFPPPKNKIPLEDILVEHSTYLRFHLKKRLLEHKLLPYECAICGRGPEWNGRELILVLDHINGVNDDNWLENLRFLCPNCNSQTATFAGKHIPKPRKEYTCQECGARITRYGKTGLCAACASKRMRKVARPPRAVLEQLLKSSRKSLPSLE